MIEIFFWSLIAVTWAAVGMHVAKHLFDQSGLEMSEPK